MNAPGTPESAWHDLRETQAADATWWPHQAPIGYGAGACQLCGCPMFTGEAAGSCNTCGHSYRDHV